uniref:NADH dehydrogenase subunit 6 n=1 Tax=Knipowitschia caucasica TaxID=637954 RepID=A0AAV2KHM4_KNICA
MIGVGWGLVVFWLVGWVLGVGRWSCLLCVFVFWYVWVCFLWCVCCVFVGIVGVFFCGVWGCFFFLWVCFVWGCCCVCGCFCWWCFVWLVLGWFFFFFCGGVLVFVGVVWVCVVLG